MAWARRLRGGNSALAGGPEDLLDELMYPFKPCPLTAEFGGLPRLFGEAEGISCRLESLLLGSSRLLTELHRRLGIGQTSESVRVPR